MDENNENYEEFKNEIFGIFDIKINDVNKNIILLNYFEIKDLEYKNYNNENDFKNSIDLLIDNQIINFQFKYKFKEEKI